MRNKIKTQGIWMMASLLLTAACKTQPESQLDTFDAETFTLQVQKSSQDPNLCPPVDLSAWQGSSLKPALDGKEMYSFIFWENFAEALQGRGYAYGDDNQQRAARLASELAISDSELAQVADLLCSGISFKISERLDVNASGYIVGVKPQSDRKLLLEAATALPFVNLKYGATEALTRVTQRLDDPALHAEARSAAETWIKDNPVFIGENTLVFRETKAYWQSIGVVFDVTNKGRDYELYYDVTHRRIKSKFLRP